MVGSLRNNQNYSYSKLLRKRAEPWHITMAHLERCPIRRGSARLNAID